MTAGLLFAGSVILFSRRRSLPSCLHLIGSVGLMMVVLTPSLDNARDGFSARASPARLSFSVELAAGSTRRVSDNTPSTPPISTPGYAAALHQ